MKYSYNWLKWYVPEMPEADKLAELITYHLFEVEGVEKREDGDNIFDIKILPNRAHDLLSHHGLAREISSLLAVEYKDPSPMYKVPHSTSSGQAGLKIEIQTDMCRRYMGRIVRNVKVCPPPDWVKMHLESIGERSINNVVDAANLTMFDCGQPMHCFDFDKVKGKIIVRMAKDGEEITTLDNKQIKLKSTDMVIADEEGVLAIAGVKGGKRAEVDANTKNIIIESANFEPTSVRKTAKAAGIFTSAAKRYENDLSPELCSFAMTEISGLFIEYGAVEFEDIIDLYPKKQEQRKLTFSVGKISKILGLEVSVIEVGNILERYKIGYKNEGNGNIFEIIVPPMRLDLEIEEDMAEEIGRVLGYDKLKPEIPKINFTPKVNEIYTKISETRNKLLSDGYSEVMTYAFANKGEVEVLESASDKKFMRTNLSDGLKESIKLNKTNSPLLGLKEARPGQQGGVKIFEIGTVWTPKEEIHVAYANEKEVKEISLDEFLSPPRPSGTPPQQGGEEIPPRLDKEGAGGGNFKMWSLFPFIARDVAVWVPENISSADVAKVITGNAGELVVRGPELFDEFKKPARLGGDAQTSYAFRLVFQSYDRTLTDTEINETMQKITDKIKEQNNWQVR